MPIGNKFGTNAVKQIWAITYLTSVVSIERRNSLSKMALRIR